MSGAPIDPEVIEPAGRVVDLARGGHTAELVADPDGGRPSARATAALFDLPAMTELLEARR